MRTETTDRSVAERPTWSPIFSAIRAVHARLGEKAAAKLAAITDSDMRSAQRFLAEDRVPNGAAVFAMVRSPEVGPAFIAQATSDLSTDDYREFWDGITVALGRAVERLKERQLSGT